MVSNMLFMPNSKRPPQTPNTSSYIPATMAAMMATGAKPDYGSAETLQSKFSGSWTASLVNQRMNKKKLVT